jgi:hypothetical protein
MLHHASAQKPCRPGGRCSGSTYAFSILIHLLQRTVSRRSPGARRDKLNPPLSSTCKSYLSALGHPGRKQEAALLHRRLLANEPDFAPERLIATSPHERGCDRDHYTRGLRLAGVPEHSGQAARQSRDQDAKGGV